MTSTEQHEILSTRTALFAPLTRPDRVHKALAASPAIADLEDAVGPDDKDSARDNLADLIGDVTPGRLTVRINDIATEVGQADVAELARCLEATRGSAGSKAEGELGQTTGETPPAGRENGTSIAPFAVMIPKAESAGQVMKVAEQLPDIPIVALVETARGVANTTELATCTPVVRLTLGALDLAVDLGCEPQGAAMSLARANVVLSSRLGNLPAPLDSPEPDVRNAEATEGAAQRAMTDGFGGMLCLHPTQAQIIAKAYLPSEADVEWAKEVLAVADDVGTVGGQMVDRPVKLRAERILKDAEQAAS